MYYTVDTVNDLYNKIIIDDTISDNLKNILYHIVNSIDKAEKNISKIDINTKSVAVTAEFVTVKV
jgi:hypothetical protein